ncbi:MAG TPA: xylose isomerase [Gammaproteobacteria bacterium]|nr:xylose isomerase [Gammaproteobacteria bacterium]
MSTKPFIGRTEFFPGIGRIPFEGPDSDNPLAFKVYDENRVVGQKTMREHLRFSVCYWHTFLGTGNDPFGPGTRSYPWAIRPDPMDQARDRIDAAFEFISKLGVPFYCFHDRDLAPDGASVAESERRLASMVELAGERQQATSIRLLWGTANLFSHPRYMNGAATNPEFDVVAHAGAQVKAALDATVALGGENYVFWGGREGYSCLFNTEIGRELDHLARFLSMARDYGRSIGFDGTFLIEPKPMEPMYHQYDSDAAAVVGFLRHYGLTNDFKVNVEANHATLAGKSFGHELKVCADAGLLGSIDANRGNPQNGWDTDQFATNLYDAVDALLVVLADGGFRTGGLNFDAKLRRESTDPEDLFIAHIGGIDTFARALLIATDLLESSPLTADRQARYASFDAGYGRDFEAGHLTLTDLRDHAAAVSEPASISGKQERIENLINDRIARAH